MAFQLKLRFARQDEAEQIIDWLNTSKVNGYNPESLKNPSMRVLCSYNDQEGPQNYILIQKVMMLDSSAPRPGLDKFTAAQSFRDFTKAALLMASAEGISEVYALDCGGGLEKMAQNHHYELVGEEVNGEFVPYKVYRIKV